MLGKLIKNEYIHRMPRLLALYAGIIVFSVVVRILWILQDDVIDNNTFGIITRLIFFMFGVAVIASFIFVLIAAVDDWGKRVFKDQGYLTHTLPVKTSTMILSRMICDIGIIISYAVVFPLVLTIATGELDFYEGIISFFTELALFSGSVIEKATILTFFISTILMCFLGLLFEMWHFYTAYALGHMFEKSKRVLSVVFYLIIYIILIIIGIIITSALENSALADYIVDVSSTNSKEVQAALLVVTIYNLLFIVITMVFGLICNYICKKKLNLE